MLIKQKMKEELKWQQKKEHRKEMEVEGELVVIEDEGAVSLLGELGNSAADDSNKNRKEV